MLLRGLPNFLMVVFYICVGIVRYMRVVLTMVMVVSMLVMVMLVGMTATICHSS